MPEPASPPRISRLRVKNFRSIAEIDIPLGPLTVLIGPNGSGKSNVVDALRFVRDVFTRGLDQAVLDREGMEVIRRWMPEGEAGEVEIEVTVKVTEGTVSYGFTLAMLRDGAIDVSNELLRLDLAGIRSILISGTAGKWVISHLNNEVASGWEWDNVGLSTVDVYKPNTLGHIVTRALGIDSMPSNKNYENLTSLDLNPQWTAISRASERISDMIWGLLFYGLNPADLRQPQRSLLESPLDEHGRNLAAVLRRLHRSDGPSLDELRTVLRRAVTGFDDLAVETVGGYLATKLLYTTTSGEARASYLGQESDGTIRMLGILAALLQEPAQPVVTIEEPEANIHPGALGVLAKTFLEASQRGQIILTTHSPDLMTHLPAECFLLVEKVDGETRVGPLNAEQAEIVRQHLFSAGELMRMQGLHRQDSAAS